MDDRSRIIEVLNQGGVGVLPTDTLYGLVARAFDPDAVERIYELKMREPEKPFIVLIEKIDDLERFGVVVSEAMRNRLETYWPGPVSIILPCPDEQFSYLHRDKYTLAFRVPDDDELQLLLAETGPLVAPSANIAGGTPARTAEEAKQYFGTDINFCVDGGVRDGAPSTLIDMSGEREIVLRN